MKKLVKICLVVILFFLTALCGLLAYAFAVTKDVNLDIDKLSSPSLPCSIYYANGEKIEPEGKNEYVQIDEIPKHVVNAVIAIEDKRFYSHSGVDVKSMIRALKNNLLSGSFKEGASTITQQLIKNTYLTGEKTINRKLREIKLALELERNLDKDSIIEKYLNTVYFGENSYGISKASKNYFNKSVSELTIEEGALLIGLLKAPTHYNPYKNYDKAKKRRDLVLTEMKNQNIISDDLLKSLKNKDIILNYERNYDNSNVLYDEILCEVYSVLNLTESENISNYKIYTLIDKELSNNFSTPSDIGIETDYTIIVTDNKSSQIIGYSSSVGEIKRCPASASKPWLIYAPAFEENLISPATKILDEKTNFNGYSPDNYGNKYYGYISVKESLSKSLNIPAVKLCNALGFDKVKKYANKMQIEYENEDLSLALGNLSGGITLKELSDCYSVFSHSGEFYSSGFIYEIKNSKGKTVYKKPNIGKKIYSDSTVFMINDILFDCAKTGTAKKLSSLQYYVCAKTGTNGNEKGNVDAYCIAYTKDYTVSVWLGKKNGEYMSNTISGGNYPTSIVKSVFESIYVNDFPEQFEKPNSIVEVSIDKKLYETDSKIYKNSLTEKDGIKFYFKKGYEPQFAPKEEKTIFIKTLKISCKSRNSEFYSERDAGVEYLVFDCFENLIFDSKGKGDFTFFAEKDGEYLFFVTPYSIINGEKIYGEKIKMPSVLVEGKKDILDDKWWED